MPQDRPDGKDVTVAEIAGEWHVIIQVPGEEPVVRSFDREDYALSFAEGYKTRLGLATVRRL